MVSGAVLVGYLMEHGNLKVLMQPAELIIILGGCDRNNLGSQPASHPDENRKWNRWSFRGLALQ